jgi:CcmD family protein
MKRLFGALIGALIGLTLSVGAEADARPMRPEDKPRIGIVHKDGRVEEQTKKKVAPKPEAKSAPSGYSDPGDSRIEEHGGTVKVAKEHLPGYPFVYAAYCFIWVGLFFYLWTLRRRQHRVSEEIARLKSRLDDADKSGQEA